jgi:DNA mismatch repair protein MutL
MQRIRILPESLINKIAAGEVVERPASVVKELVENAIDAGSDQIFVTVRNGGRDFISVLDNGSGMSMEDAKLAIERHATSKIINPEDLYHIQTMGFRGEALAAIAAVSRFELTTCGDENEGGFQIRLEGGQTVHAARIGFPRGTRVVVENLFFNTPARQKFMKSANTEYQHIHNLVLNLALGRPEIQFRLIHNKTITLSTPKDQDFGQRVASCFGDEIRQDLVSCAYQEPYLSFSGLISLPSAARSSKRWQHTFVNHRHVRSKTIGHAVYEGYKTLLMKHMHPLFFLKLELSPGEIDVNVHPAKTEIRLKNPNLIHTILVEQISRLLKLQTRQQIYPDNSGSVTTKTDQKKPPVPTHSTPSPTSNQKPTLPVTSVDPIGQIGFMPPPPVSRIDTHQRSIDAKTPVPEPPESELAPSDPFSFSRDTAPTSSDPFPPPSRHLAIGQLAEKYILAQGDHSMVLVDQHAAHERIRFEEIRHQFYNQALVTQTLLIPILIELPPQDGLLLEQHQESWKKLGFIIDHFGGNDYSIREIPAIVKDCDIPAIIRDVLDEMAQFGKSGKLELFFNEVFERMACHSAIRASQKLNLREMQSLLDRLNELDLHLHCPHGRPVIVEIPLEELDKRFKR